MENNKDLPSSETQTTTSQDPPKRRQRDTQLKDTQRYNQELICYANKLEFAIIQKSQKITRIKSLFRRYIVSFANQLEKQGLSIPVLPTNLLRDDNLSDLDSLLQQLGTFRNSLLPENSTKPLNENQPKT